MVLIRVRDKKVVWAWEREIGLHSGPRQSTVDLSGWRKRCLKPWGENFLLPSPYQPNLAAVIPKQPSLQ